MRNKKTFPDETRAVFVERKGCCAMLRAWKREPAAMKWELTGMLNMKMEQNSFDVKTRESQSLD